MRALTGSLSAALLAGVLVGAGLGAPAPAAADGLPIPLPTSPEGDVAGVNDWGCRPSADHPRPIVLVHGTFGDRKHLLENLSNALLGQGYCVFSLDYGNRGTQDVVTSAKTLAAFTDEVLAATGARKVSMVGHSQGGMMPRYYIKFLGGKKKVDDLVGLVPSNHGTQDTGPGNPLTEAVFGVVCPACVQQSAGSPFLTRLNAGDETPGKVSYTQITTRYDEVVTPYLSAYLAPGRKTTNITLQDLCPYDQSEHVIIPTDQVAIQLVLNALGRKGPADPAFRPAC
jgi:triacylglycerol esterase/lipase EstA (alpha/beta hydrolase family)